MKRRVITSVLTLFVMGVVSAASSTEEFLRRGGYLIGDMIGFVTTALLGEPFYGGIGSIENNAVFLKFLLFIIMLVFIGWALKKNKLFADTVIRRIVTFCVAVMSIRYLPREMFDTAASPYYTAIIILFAGGLSYVALVFIHRNFGTSYGRRLMSVLYALLLTLIMSFWLGDGFQNNWAYWIGMTIPAVAIIFDKRVHKKLRT